MKVKKNRLLLTPKAQRGMIAGLLFLTLARGILYIVSIPPWQSPDEPTHFEYVQVLADGARFFSPRPDLSLQKRIIVSLDRYNYWRYVGEERPRSLPATFETTPFVRYAPSQIGKNPPLYYILASMVLRLSPPASISGKLYYLRALSLIFILGMVWIVFLVSRQIFENDFIFCLTSAAFAAFLPQFMVIGTSVSPDPLVNLLGAGVIYLVIRGQKYGFTWLRAVFILLLYALGLLVSYKFLVLIPALFGAWLIYILFHTKEIILWKRFLVRWIFLVIILISGYCWLVWSFPEIARIFIVRINKLHSIISRYLLGKTIFPEGHWLWFNKELFKSFWLKFGWLKFELSPNFYLILGAAAVVSFFGIVVFFIKWFLGKSGLKAKQRESIVTLILYAAIALGAYYAFWGLKGAHTTTQGRHLFLVLPAWSILFVHGWKELFPIKWKEGVYVGLLLGFIMLDAISLFGYILPTFH